MRNGFWGWNGIFMGALAAFVSSALVLGGFMLAMSENVQELFVQPETPQVISQVTPLPPIAASPTLMTFPSATASPTPSPSQTASPSATIFTSPSACIFPEGWIPYTVQRGETLNPLAARFGLDPQDLADANCLTTSQQVVPGLILYVPGTSPLPPIASPIPCAPPLGWVIYIVRPGDTLYSLGLRVHMSTYELQLANCLPSSYIYVGQRLYLPFYPGPLPTSPIPWPTAVPTYPFPTETRIPTDTAVPTPPPPTEPPPPDGDISSSPSPPAIP